MVNTGRPRSVGRRTQLRDDIRSPVHRTTRREQLELFHAFAVRRCATTSVATSIHQHNARRRHRFSWSNEWKERTDGQGRPLGIELILPDWFYAGVLEESLVLTTQLHRKSGSLARFTDFAYDLRINQ